MERRVVKIPQAIKALPESYLGLLAEFPLRPITTGKEYERAVKIVHRLALREGKLDRGEESFLEVLETLVERYDEAHHPMNADDVSPTQALRMLVDQAGMSVTELGKLLGSKERCFGTAEREAQGAEQVANCKVVREIQSRCGGISASGDVAGKCGVEGVCDWIAGGGFDRDQPLGVALEIRLDNSLTISVGPQSVTVS